MSRRECKHGAVCGDDLCPCDPGDVGECPDFEASGWTPPAPRDPDVLRRMIAEKREAFARLKCGSGFRFGQGAIAQKEAQRRRREISRLVAELGEQEDEQ